MPPVANHTFNPFPLLQSSKSSSSSSSTSSPWSGWGEPTRPPGGGGPRRPPRADAGEPFYGLGDFFRDLEKDLAGRAAARRGAGRGGGPQPPPRSLWEELADLGSEFLEFLEKEAGLPPERPTAAAGASTEAWLKASVAITCTSVSETSAIR